MKIVYFLFIWMAIVISSVGAQSEILWSDDEQYDVLFGTGDKVYKADDIEILGIYAIAGRDFLKITSKSRSLSKEASFIALDQVMAIENSKYNSYQLISD